MIDMTMIVMKKLTALILHVAIIHPVNRQVLHLQIQVCSDPKPKNAMVIEIHANEMNEEKNSVRTE